MHSLRTEGHTQVRSVFFFLCGRTFVNIARSEAKLKLWAKPAAYRIFESRKTCLIPTATHREYKGRQIQYQVQYCAQIQSEASEL